MIPTAIWDTKKLFYGSWMLPQDDGFSVTISFSKAEFRYVVNARKSAELVRQVLSGHEMHGTWEISKTYPGDGLLSSSARGSVGSSLRAVNIFAPPSQRGEPQMYTKDQIGPFLILRFTDLPRSFLNPNILGLRVEIANVLNKLREPTAPDAFKILDITSQEIKLEGRKGVEVWHKVD